MAVLSESQREARWKSIILKVLIVLNVHAVKERVVAALGGKDNYLRIFQQVETPEVEQPAVTRIVDQEIVGKPIEPGVGEAEGAGMDPAMCQHPMGKMKDLGFRA